MTFSAVRGQDKPLALIGRALAGGRLAHAYLFAGPDGVGKTTVALDLAAVLLCREPVHDRPCGTCPGCLKRLSGNHPDFLRIRPDGAAIKIDQIRALKRALTYPPFEAERRVVLVEEVQTMRREAGNSLLKLLEEPPPDNLLILVGGSTGSILATIVSRCQVIPFAPLPLPLAAEIIGAHRPEMDAADCQALAALAEGCPGQALALEAEGILPLYRRLVTALTVEPGHLAERVETALALAAEMAALGESEPLLLVLLRIFLKNSLAARAGVTRPDWPAEILRARERWNLPQLSAKMAAIERTEKALARNCSRSLASEVLLLELFDCTPPPS